MIFKIVLFAVYFALNTGIFLVEYGREKSKRPSYAMGLMWLLFGIPFVVLIFLFAVSKVILDKYFQLGFWIEFFQGKYNTYPEAMEKLARVRYLLLYKVKEHKLRRWALKKCRKALENKLKDLPVPQ